MAHTWDPERYLAYADERSRPLVDLLHRIPAPAPGAVVDLGCGPGNSTRVVADRWGTQVTGLDSSAEMIDRARADHPDLDFRVEDLRTWLASGPDPVDVLVSNAVLQWVPDHLDLMPGLVRATAPGGWLAFQVPGNFEEPSHSIRRELAAQPPYAAFTAGIAAPAAHDPVVYLEALSALGCEVDAWETTYLHVLRGTDPVFTWVSGTGARPTLEALPGDVRPAFEAELRRRLAVAYPARPDGTVVLPFRRVFVVARTPA
ncbi:methyltransferase domain-containing protein [Cellulomonas rhizosphaerae]|uniref:Methyltransferase domain-containing protein n=1 Tax=Cellulomonas rhizosphaerae TaxID=2293719 RepID=A0A413RP91_9CELL|nr:methyltransferase domain-containing protein [Cellulomonas rhizosphaerae]RHA43765.1 methyltransferase domain-containing protein [Cellulomonas rhizosphaerae]